MKKSDHDHYIEEGGIIGVKPTLYRSKSGKWLLRYRCPICQLLFDLPIQVRYDSDSDINERKS